MPEHAEYDRDAHVSRRSWRWCGGIPFIGDYIGIDSTDALVAVAWTGNGPISQDVYAAALRP
jgi:hypothetical protein